MSEVRTGPVAVGIDGSGTARSAVRWAAREAVRRGTTLRIVYADVFALPVIPELPGIAWPKDHHAQVRAEVERWLSQAARAATQTVPEVTVETASCAGTPESVLISESESAGLVVVGDRGLGGFTGLLAGSVAVAVAAHSHSSTVVVRGTAEQEQVPAGGAVVVGLDGSSHAQALLPHAFDAAVSLDAPLHVVHTWNLVGVDTKWVRVGLATDEVQANEERLLSEILGGWSEKYPDVEVHRFVRPGAPAAELLQHAQTAHMIVVGSRGRGGFTGMLLGSTSQALIHYAPCPVMIVRTGSP